MKSNRLIHETSPYLLHHAHNPVDWYPWGEEAFAKARQEDKPVFLSIGYSTCHWCHVMERESFEDEKVADMLNGTFVNVKVDREERPDIDAVYMKACQMMTQTGGWPLTIMMTPDKKPFFAATYIPRETKYGHVGLMEIIPQVEALWRTRREEVLTSAVEITQALTRIAVHPPKDVSEETMHRAYRSLLMSYDKTFGGFGQAPKFPSPHNLFFLLRYWKRTGEEQALKMAEHTLQNMRNGGIYDQIGFGFHRYSTDNRWVLPHFEKMLYDQALMAMAYTELYQVTRKREYESTAREIFAYVLRDLSDAKGGFYCAEDADSEGIEGKFYFWTDEEIRTVLNEDEADWFLSHYRHDEDIDLQGMKEIPEGAFIPHLRPVPLSGEGEDTAGEMKIIREKFFAVREKRAHPGKDDKILTDWNGLMIAALAKGAQVFDEPAYVQAAIRAADFITRFLRTEEGRLLHRYRDGQAGIAATVDDYAFVIWAMLELYEATFETTYLLSALEYHSHLCAYFRDERHGGLFFTPTDAEVLLSRPKEIYDGAIPSGNSVAFMNALKLSRITGDVEMDERAHEIYRAFGHEVDAMPTAFTHFLVGLDFAMGPASEVVIAGNRGDVGTKRLLEALRKNFIPNKVVVLRPEQEGLAEIETIAPYVAPCLPVDGKATAYVCANFTCSLPTHDSAQMMKLLTKA